MSVQNIGEPLLDMFLFETTQLIEQLEQNVLSSEQENYCFTKDAINENFRIMHTIKGSAAMMMFQNISTIAHSMEDIFYYLREEKPQELNFTSLSDLVLDDETTYVFEVDEIKKIPMGKIKTVEGISKVEFEENIIKVKLTNKIGKLNDIVEIILASGCLIHNMKRIESSLETVFLELTGKSLRD